MRPVFISRKAVLRRVTNRLGRSHFPLFRRECLKIKCCAQFKCIRLKYLVAICHARLRVRRHTESGNGILKRQKLCRNLSLLLPVVHYLPLKRLQIRNPALVKPHEPLGKWRADDEKAGYNNCEHYNARCPSHRLRSSLVLLPVSFEVFHVVAKDGPKHSEYHDNLREKPRGKFTAQKGVNERNEIAGNHRTGDEEREKEKPFADSEVHPCRLLARAPIDDTREDYKKRECDGEGRPREANRAGKRIVVARKRVGEKRVHIVKEKREHAPHRDIERGDKAEIKKEILWRKFAVFHKFVCCM